ncbi:uncharacterized protein LOC114526946 [Dendronephthya gigantea]|uniref:uncharacterized protein LOC114526946 n=1 Tax=Dendronephthya gigantea TaxID=151771 RepID=UPI0010691399|nr:uncharacterized protein LOC114526946 [Dendronephthya gigantea]
MLNDSYRELEDCFRSYIVTKATTSYIINSAICCTVNLILFFVGTVLNALVIYVFWRTPTLRFKVSYFMIMVLSTNDILVTTIVHPAHLIMSIAEMVGKPRCGYKAFYHIASIVLSGMSLLTFFVMNIERYLSVVHPIFHLRHVTKFRCIIVCSVFWLLTIFGGPFAYVVNYNGQFILTFAAVVIILGTCYIYIAIFYIARKKRHAARDKRKKANAFVVEDVGHTNLSISTSTGTTENFEVPLENGKSDCPVDNPSHINDRINESNSKTDQFSDINSNSASPREKVQENSKTISFFHDLQLAKMYLLVVFSSFVLNLPNAIGLALHHDRLHVVDGWVQSKIWTVTLVLMSSTVNCLIFFWANETLRKEGRKVYKRIFQR